MKKVLFLLIFLISVSYANNFNVSEMDKGNFEKISIKYTYYVSKNDSINARKYYNELKKIDAKRASEFDLKLKEVGKIFDRVFKTSKNLAPKIIKYIYFEPITTDDKNIKNEIKEKIMVSFYGNPNAKIYINTTDKSYLEYYNMLIKAGAKKENIILIDKPLKEILGYIKEDIYKDFNNKTKFGKLENRISLITSSSTIKQKLALTYGFLSKSFEGIEIEDFSYLDEDRHLLQVTSDIVRMDTYNEFINGIY